jgi:hypothetical protein
MKLYTLCSQIILVALLGAILAGCKALPEPGPTPTVGASLLATPTRGGGPLPTATSSELVAPSPTRPVSPLATPASLLPNVTIAAPTAASSPTATPTPPPTSTSLPTPTVPPSAPLATPLIAVATPTSISLTATRALPTATRAPTLLPLPTRTPAPTHTPVPTIPAIQVTAWVSDTNPPPGVDVTVYGRLLVNGQPVAHEGMVASWHLKGRTVDCVADTGPDGIAYCSVNTYGLPAGYTVRIQVFIKVNQPPYQTATELTIR